MTTDYSLILSRIEKLRRGVRGWHGRCPCKDNHKNGDKNGSLMLWVSEENGSLRAKCFKGCRFVDIAAALGTRAGDWFPPRVGFRIRPPGRVNMAGEITATYDYCDEDGKLLYQCCRLKREDGSKGFFQRRPMPDGGWANTLAGGFFRQDGSTWYQVQEGSHSDAKQFLSVRLVPFGLPFLHAHPDFPCIVVEGEKDVLTLEAVFAGKKICVTTNPMGAKKWPWHFGKFLAGRRVTIIPDNDDVGFEHGCLVAANAIAFGCESVRMVRWADGQVKGGGDVTDWLEDKFAGKSVAEKCAAVVELAKGAEEYKRGKAAA